MTNTPASQAWLIEAVLKMATELAEVHNTTIEDILSHHDLRVDLTGADRR